MKVFHLVLTLVHHVAACGPELFHGWLTLSVITLNQKVQSCFPNWTATCSLVIGAGVPVAGLFIFWWGVYHA